MKVGKWIGRDEHGEDMFAPTKKEMASLTCICFGAFVAAVYLLGLLAKVITQGG